jgi:hypothetical protein
VSAPSTSALVGVRRQRHGPLILATLEERAASDRTVGGAVPVALSIGEVVLLEADGETSLALVVIPPGLLLAAPPVSEPPRVVAAGQRAPAIARALAERNARAGLEAQTILGGAGRVRAAIWNLDGARLDLDVEPLPAEPAVWLDRLAAHFQADVRLTTGGSLRS